jgi:hypothetical protein
MWTLSKAKAKSLTPKSHALSITLHYLSVFEIQHKEEQNWLSGLLVFHCCDKIPDINKLREEGFILAPRLRNYSP